MKNSWVIGPLSIVTEKRIIQDGYLQIQDKKIHSICLEDNFPPDIRRIATNPQHICMPGMIDQHIHGIAGVDVMDATPEALETMSTSLVKHGVTSFLATTMTDSIENILRALVNIKHRKKDLNGAELLGVHLEGPFINIKQKGAQSEQYILLPNIEEFKKIYGAVENELKLVTIAGELDEDYGLLQFLKEEDMVASIGHSDATYVEMSSLLNAKLIQSATHFCNGMRNIHHREPGLQLALLESQAMLEIIADGYHIHPAMIQSIVRHVGCERIILISDSIRANGLPDGTYDLGGQLVQVHGKFCRLVEGNSIAGSVLNLNDARNFMKEWLQLSYVELAKITATNSARLLRINHKKGAIKAGLDADFYILNKNDCVVMTVCNGRVVYQEGDLNEPN